MTIPQETLDHHGLVKTHTGGGCMAYEAEADGFVILITDGEFDLPATAISECCVGCYNLDGEYLGGPIPDTYDNLALAMEAGREWIESNLADPPCPINRRPQPTCPDGCSHGA